MTSLPARKDDFVLEDTGAGCCDWSDDEDAKKESGGVRISRESSLRIANCRQSPKETRATEVGLALPGAVLVTRGPSNIARIEDDESSNTSSSGWTSTHPFPMVEEMFGSGPIHATLVSEEEEADENQLNQKPEPQLVEAQVLPVRTYAIVTAIVFVSVIALGAVFLTTRKKSSYQIPTTTASPSHQPTMAPTIDYRQRLERYDQVVSFLVSLVSFVTDQCLLVDNKGNNNNNWLVTASCQDNGIPSDLYLAGHRSGIDCHRVNDSTITCQLEAARTGFIQHDSIAFVCGATLKPDLNSTAIVVVEGLRLLNCSTRNMVEPANFTLGIVSFCESNNDSNLECSDSSFIQRSQNSTFCTYNGTKTCVDDVTSAKGCNDDNDSITFSDRARAVKVINNETCSSPTWETNRLYPLLGFLLDTR